MMMWRRRRAVSAAPPPTAAAVAARPSRHSDEKSSFKVGAPYITYLSNGLCF
jgi:hypothetical protein